MSRLLACPFCRELFDEDESNSCPQCDVELVPMEKLPPSAEVLAEELASGHYVPPDLRRFPFWYLGRGRAALLLLSVLGLGLFFSPWVTLSRPDPVSLSAFELARGNAGWLLGGGIGWFLLIPLVMSRRTPADLRGVRIICTAFAALTLGEVAMMLLKPPVGNRYFDYGLVYAWGLYASGIVSILAAGVATRLGGAPISDPLAQTNERTAAADLDTSSPERGDDAEAESDERVLH